MIDNTDRIAQAQLIAMWMKAEGIRSISLPGNDVSTFTMHWQERGYYGSVEVPQLPPGTPVGAKAEEFLIHGLEGSIEHRVCGEHIIDNPWDLKGVNVAARNHVCKPEESSE